MLVGSPERGRAVAVHVDQRVMPQRLDEDSVASRLQHTQDLAIAPLEIEVMQDSSAADDIEGIVGELELLGVHHAEIDALG